MTNSQRSPLGLLEPGALLGGALFDSLLLQVADGERLPVGTRLGPFRVGEEIGRGGMGLVYRAERDDGEYRQTVAIKSLASSGTEQGLELFRRERQVLAELKHPHIARLLDGGHQADGRLWFAMELVDGRHIDAHVRALQLPVEARLKLLRQVIDAVAFAHQRLLIHRDIKPGNVLVDADGSVKLLDFGIAALIGDDGATRAYSPAWASPEQWLGDDVGPASDQFQLGLLLDAVLCSDAPVMPASATVAAVAADVRGTTLLDSGTSPSRARRIDPARWLPISSSRRAELVAIATRSTAEFLEARYGSVAELGAEIDRWLEVRPVAAYGGGVAYTARCAVRRHPLIASLSLITVIGIAALVGGFSWRVAQERDLARTEAARAEREAATAQAINRFLNEDLLAAANPYAEGRSDVTVREVLDRARARVARRFAERTAEEAAIRATLGHSYRAVGEFDAARSELERALELVAQREGTGSDAALELRFDLGLVAQLTSRNDDAEAIYAALEPLVVARYGAESAEALDLATRMAAISLDRDRPELATNHLVALIPRLRAALGDLHPLTLDALATLGDAQRDSAQYDAAQSSLQEAHAGRTRTVGADDPAALQALQSLALLDRARGDFEAALATERKVLEGRQRTFGREHPETQNGLNEVASLLQDLKRYDEAEPIFREVLAIRERTVGDSHDRTRNSLNNLGLVLSLQNKLDEAEIHYRRALVIERKLLGDDHIDVLTLVHNLAGVARKRGNLSQAETLHRDAVERASRTLGDERPEPGLFRIGLAQTLQLRGRHEEAAREFANARATLVRAYGIEHPRIARVDEMIAALNDEIGGP